MEVSCNGHYNIVAPFPNDSIRLEGNLRKLAKVVARSLMDQSCDAYYLPYVWCYSN